MTAETTTPEHVKRLRSLAMKERETRRTLLTGVFFMTLAIVAGGLLMDTSALSVAILAVAAIPPLLVAKPVLDATINLRRLEAAIQHATAAPDASPA